MRSLLLVVVLLFAAPVAARAADPFPLREYAGGIQNAEDLLAPDWIGSAALLTAHTGSSPDIELRTLDGKRSVRYRGPVAAQSQTFAAPARGGYVVSVASSLRTLDASMKHFGPRVTVPTGRGNVVGLTAAGSRVLVLVETYDHAYGLLYRIAGSKLIAAGRTPSIPSGDEAASYGLALAARGGALFGAGSSGEFALLTFDRDGRKRVRRNYTVEPGNLDYDGAALTPDGRFAVVYNSTSDLRVGVGSTTKRPRLRRVAPVEGNVLVGLVATPAGLRVAAVDRFSPTQRLRQLSVSWTGTTRVRTVPLDPAVKRALAATGGGDVTTLFVSPVGDGLRAWIQTTRVQRSRWFAYQLTPTGSVLRGGEVPVPTKGNSALRILPGLGGPLVSVLPGGGEEQPSATLFDAPAQTFGAPIATAPTATRLSDGSVVYAASGAPGTTRLQTDGTVGPGPTLPFNAYQLRATPDGGFWAYTDGTAGGVKAVRVAADGTVGPVQTATLPVYAYSVTPSSVVTADGHLLLGWTIGDFSCDDPEGKYCQPSALNRTCFVTVADTVAPGACVDASGLLVAHGTGALLLAIDGTKTTSLTNVGTLDGGWGTNGTAPTGRAAQKATDSFSAITATPDGGFSALNPGTYYAGLTLAHFNAAGTHTTDQTIPGVKGFTSALLTPIDGAIVISDHRVGRAFTPAQVSG